MKIGLNLPQLGIHADPQAARSFATAAEGAGFSSLWAVDRLLAPVAPRSAYPGTPDGRLPTEQKIALDPLVTLTLAAAVTDRIRLGTDVLVAPWYRPALLARTLATLDQVSCGRLTVGLGLGWSVDEYEAVGLAMRNTGRRLDAIIDVLEHWWGDDEVEVETMVERIVPSVVGLKPVQSPRIRVLLAAFNPFGLDRVARRADGWLPVGIPMAVIAQMWAGVRESAERCGRDPEELSVVLRAEVKLADTELGADRTPFAGTRRQVANDIEEAREVGMTEVILDLQASARSSDEMLDLALALTAEQPALIGAAG